MSRCSLAVLVVALLGCRRGPDGVSTVDEVAQPAGGPITVTAVGSGAPVGVGMAPPPGTDKVVRVPADVAAKVEIREVVRGLARPTALVIAPGDARRRLFIT